MASEGLVYVIDDDADLAGSVARLLRREGYVAEPLIDPETLIKSYEGAAADCIVSDIMMGATNGFDLAMKIRAFDPAVAVVFMTAWASTPDAVDAVRKYGGIDYLEKPLDSQRLLAAVREGVEWSRERREKIDKVMRLSPREREVFEYIARGLSSKAIAVEMGLSPRTIEDHRAKILAKTESASLADLISLTT